MSTERPPSAQIPDTPVAVDALPGRAILANCGFFRVAYALQNVAPMNAPMNAPKTAPMNRLCFVVASFALAACATHSASPNAASVGTDGKVSTTPGDSTT